MEPTHQQATSRDLVASPQTYARIGGVLYLIIVATGLFGELVARGRLIVSGDAAATAGRIAESLSLWRAGIAGDLVMHMADVGLMLAFYVLLRPVDRNIALFALIANLMQSSVLVANTLLLMVPVFLVEGNASLAALPIDQAQALAYLALKAHSNGFGFGLIFFAMTCIAMGYLIVRSGYLPKVLGFGMQVAGICYLVNSFALILSPPLANRLFPVILLPAFVAELSMALWLLVKGVDLAKWRERERAVAGSSA